MVNNNKDKDENKDPFDFHKRDKEFQRMIHDLERMMREQLRDISRNKMEPGSSYIHGFNIDIGEEGKAEVREFGNYPKRKSIKRRISEEKEPDPDVIAGDKEVSVTIQLPDLKKEDIDLRVIDKNLELTVNTPKKRYHKKIPLSSEVKPNTTKATYKNGILDVTIEKKKKKRGYKANID